MAGTLPPLSSEDKEIYGRAATTMGWYHQRLKDSWKALYEACSSGKRPANTSIRQFLNIGSNFCHHLGLHHSIEEQNIFPILAQRMPAFGKELELLTQHKEIHKGMDMLEAYLDDCKSGRRDLRMAEMKEVLDSFGTVLWSHLQDEVDELSPDKMRQYWSIEEVKRLPM